MFIKGQNMYFCSEAHLRRPKKSIFQHFFLSFWFEAYSSNVSLRASLGNEMHTLKIFGHAHMCLLWASQAYCVFSAFSWNRNHRCPHWFERQLHFVQSEHVGVHVALIGIVFPPELERHYLENSRDHKSTECKCIDCGYLDWRFFTLLGSLAFKFRILNVFEVSQTGSNTLYIWLF